MAQSVWEKKLATLFNRFDKGSKGNVTKNDVEAQINAFKTIGYLTKEEEDQMRQTFTELWNVFLNGNDSVTLKEWIEGHRLLLNRDKSQISPLEGLIKRAGTLMFKAADKERKGAISEEGFGVFLACLGVKDQTKEIFKKLDISGQGEIKEDEFSHAFHEFNFQLEDATTNELLGPLVC